MNSLQKHADSAINSYMNLALPWDSKSIEERQEDERNTVLSSYNKLFENMSTDEYKDMLAAAEKAWDNPPGTEDPETDALLELQQRQQDRLDKQRRRR